MREARLVKERKCRQCPEVVVGDAKAMRAHEEDHNLAERAARSGLVIAKPRVWKAGETYGNQR